MELDHLILGLANKLLARPNRRLYRVSPSEDRHSSTDMEWHHHNGGLYCFSSHFGIGPRIHARNNRLLDISKLVSWPSRVLI